RIATGRAAGVAIRELAAAGLAARPAGRASVGFGLRPAAAARGRTGARGAAPSAAPDVGRAERPGAPPPARPPGDPAPPLRGARASEAGRKDFRNVVSEASELGGASARAEKSARDAYAAVPAPAQDLGRAPPPRDLDRQTARGFDRAADRAANERPQQYDRAEQ